MAKPQTLHHRAHPQTQGAYVIHIIHLQQRETLALAIQNIMDLINNEGIRSTAEGGYHHKVHVIFAVSHIVCRLEHAVRIGPLGNGHQFLIDRLVVVIRHKLSHHINTHIGKHVRNLVLDERVGVVRATCQHHHHSVLFPGLPHNFLRTPVLFGDKLTLCAFSHVYRLFGSLASDTQRGQILATAHTHQGFFMKRDHRGVKGNAKTLLRIYSIPHHIGIASHNGAVVAIASPVVSPLFHHNIRIENAIHPTLYQVVHMTMHQLGWETDILGHHSMDALLI